MAGNKKTHNIYLIDMEKVSSSFELPEDVSKQIAVEKIMSKDGLYHIQELKDDIDTQAFSISLFFRSDYGCNNKFSSFCSNFVKEDQEAVTFMPSSASSVLFVWSNKNIFAITTGQGFRLVEDYAVLKFGLIIATLFESYLKVTSLGSSELSSVIHSSRTVYTTEVEFQSVETLDTIFKEIGGRISNLQLIHDLLNLDRSSKKKSVKLKAKDYLQLGSSLDIKGLLHLLRKLDEMDISQVADGFNAITPLSNKRDKTTIDAINLEIAHSIYDALSNDRICPFELFHKDTDSFIFADKYQIYKATTKYADEEDYNATQILKNGFIAFLKEGEWTEEAFKYFLMTSKIKSIREDNIVTDGSVLQHLSGEIELAGTTYFVLDGKYYCQNESYTQKLNEFLRRKLREDIYTQEIQTEWTTHNEDWFNATVSRNEGYIELHRVLIDNIEFADLIKCSGDTLTVVHVKDKFDGEMRILDRQVEMSIRMLLDVKHNNNHSFMSRLYRKAVEDNARTDICRHIPSEQQFITQIKNNKVRYIIVVHPTEKKLLNSRSNIAKHCLNALIDRCFRRGIELKIQVK